MVGGLTPAVKSTSATVEFEFISNPEFVKEGMKLLFREGKTKVGDFF